MAGVIEHDGLAQVPVLTHDLDDLFLAVVGAHEQLDLPRQHHIEALRGLLGFKQHAASGHAALVGASDHALTQCQRSAREQHGLAQGLGHIRGRMCQDITHGGSSFCKR